MPKASKKSSKKTRDPNARDLRVAYVWNNTVQFEEQLDDETSVVLGDSGIFPLPEGVGSAESLTLLEPVQNGYRLVPSENVGGAVWVAGQRTSVNRLGAGNIALGPNDYGVLTVGPVAVFFQQVTPAEPLKKSLFRIEPTVLACMLLSFFLFGVFFFIAYLDWQMNPPENPDDLNADLITKYLVTPPPEDLFEELRESGTDEEDPGQKDRDEGGKAMEKEEGRVGREDAPQEDTHIEGEVRDEIATKVRSKGLLGALSGGGEGNAIAAALDDVPNVSDILAGMGGGPTVIGKGSRGAGLRGSGTGGGGDGPGGSLFGAGKLGTGSGVGKGGLGTGKGGPGARGKRAERKISVKRGKPRVNGYLSPEQINRVVRANQAAVRYCYETEVQRQPNLKGRVEISWRIGLTGTVSTSRVASSSLKNSRVEGCIVRQVRRWRFPKPDGGEVRVTYPFIFGVSGG